MATNLPALPKPFIPESTKALFQPSIQTFFGAAKHEMQAPKDTFERLSKIQEKAEKALETIGKRKNTDELLTRAMFSLLVTLNTLDKLPQNSESDKIKESIALDIEKALETIALSREIASRHPLSKLRNEASYEDTLNKAIKKTLKSKTPFVMAMVDIDYFKDVNDNKSLGTKIINGQKQKGYGSHETGDVALKVMGQALKEALGEDGEAFHLHGEEFTLFIPNKTMAEAKAVLSRVSDHVFKLRNNTEQFKRSEDQLLLELFKHRPLALSIGAVEVNKDALKQIDPSLKKNSKHTAEAIKTLKALEDSAMYAAKENGRNRIYTLSANPKAKAEPLYIGEEFKYKAGTVMSNNG